MNPKKETTLHTVSQGEKTQVLELPVALGLATWRNLAWKIEGDIK